jgi:hypothetical protein
LIAFLELAHCMVVTSLFGALFYSLFAHSRLSFQ